MSSTGAPQASAIVSTPHVKLEPSSENAPASLITFNPGTLLQYLADTENLEYLLRVEPVAILPYRMESDDQQDKGIVCSYRLGKVDDSLDKSYGGDGGVDTDGDIIVGSDTNAEDGPSDTEISEGGSSKDETETNEGEQIQQGESVEEGSDQFSSSQTLIAAKKSSEGYACTIKLVLLSPNEQESFPKPLNSFRSEKFFIVSSKTTAYLKSLFTSPTAFQAALVSIALFVGLINRYWETVTFNLNSQQWRKLVHYLQYMKRYHPTTLRTRNLLKTIDRN